MLDPKVDKVLKSIRYWQRRGHHRKAAEKGQELLAMAAGNRAIVEYWIEEFLNGK